MFRPVPLCAASLGLAFALSLGTAPAAAAPLTAQLGGEEALVLGVTVPRAAFEVADIDGDGTLDVVLMDDRRDQLVWEPSGPFRGGDRPSTTIGPFDPSLDFEVVDVDLDGDLDVVALAVSGTLQWFANPGGLGNWARTDLESGIIPDTTAFTRSTLRIVDLNQDTWPDICFAQGRDAAMPAMSGVLLGTGPGTFAPVTPLLPPGGFGQRMLFADLDADGDLDVASSGFLGGVAQIYSNDGALPLTLVETISAGPGGTVIDLELADIDADGDTDVLMLASPGASILVALNDGSLQLSAPVSLATPLIGLRALSVADVTGDGLLDLVGGSRLPDQVRVYPGTGALSFGPAVIVGNGERAEELLVVDFDQDGAPDLITVHDLNRMRYSRNTGAGGVSFEPSTDVAAGFFGVDATTILDVDSDGDLDIVVGGFDLACLRNIGDGRFLPAVPILPQVQSATHLASADLNRDGFEDLVLGSSTFGALRSAFALSTGTGTFDPPVPLGASGGVLLASEFLDLNGDGTSDLLVATSSLSSQNGAVGWFPGEPSGLGAFQLIDSQSAGFQYAAALDMDLDGVIDVVTSSGEEPSELRWYRGTGAGAFAAGVVFATTFPPASTSGFEKVDVDRDGHFDLLRSETGGAARATWHPSSLSGPTAGGNRTTLLSSFAALDLMPAIDVDLDGSLDLVTLERFGAFGTGGLQNARVAWRQLFPDGTVGPRRTAGRGFLGGDGAAGDLDGDGDLDLVVTSRITETVAMFRSRALRPLGTASCEPAEPTSAGPAARIDAVGSPEVSDNRFRLLAWDLPPNSAGFFLASRTAVDPTTVPGSAGELCLGGAIGRFVGPGQVGFSGTAGALQLSVDLNEVASPTGLVVVLPGDSWSFQAWFRDVVAGASTSNFTSAVTVVFE